MNFTKGIESIYCTATGAPENPAKILVEFMLPPSSCYGEQALTSTDRTVDKIRISSFYHKVRER